jgi:hypothetical protein
MTKNNALRLTLLLLCLAAIMASVSSCSKSVDQPVGNGWQAWTAPATPDYYFSRVRYFKDGRKPATDTTWTLHLTSEALVQQYQKNDGYVYGETSTYTELGTLWSK